MKNKNKADQLSPKKKNSKRWLILATIFLFIILSLVGLTIAFEFALTEKIYPGIKIGYLDVSAQTEDQVLSQLKKIEENIQQKGLIFQTQGKEIAINSIVISAADPDLAKQILVFNWPATVAEAYRAGRGSNWWANSIQQAKIYLFSKQIPVHYDLNREEITNILKANFSELEKQPANAQLKIEGEKIEVTKEEDGYIFDYDQAVLELIGNIENLDFQPIQLKLNYQNEFCNLFYQ